METPYSALDERSRRRTIEKGRFNTFYEYKHSTFVSRQKIFWEQNRVASHLFTGGLAGIGKLPALVGWYIWYGITPANSVNYR